MGIRAIGPTDAPRKVELGSVLLTVLPKAPEDRQKENNCSVGIRVQYGVFSALLPGDAEGAERAWWLAHASELCDACAVLKLAHHGSRNGTDARWLGAVRPRVAVASLGAGNEFGHPHPETVALLARAGIPLLRTDEAGTVAFASDGRRWWVAEGRPAGRAPPGAAQGVAPGARPGRGAKPAPAAGPIDLNEATEAELKSLPGIGPALARRIVAGRPYRSIEELRRVPGIGPKHLDAIRPLVIAD